MTAVDDLDRLLAPITAWARSRSDILALALIGSWARGAARPESDIDLIVLTTELRAFRDDKSWPTEIVWNGWRVAGWSDIAYGAAWSRHIRLEPACEVEFTFCAPDWAATDPLDPDTAGVVSKGCRVLVDKDCLLKDVLTAVPR